MTVRHVVKKGECLSSIAAAYGFADWRDVYDDPANEGFRERRPNPHVIFPGDELEIPVLPEAQLDLEVGRPQTIEIERLPPALRLKVLDRAEGDPVQARYVLHLEGVAAPLRGDVEPDGTIEVPLPPAVTGATLRLEAADGSPLSELQLQIGDLDPVSEPSGVRERLRRLGFVPEDDDDEPLGPLAEAALREFQLRYGLEETGTPTQETQDKLVALVGV